MANKEFIIVFGYFQRTPARLDFHSKLIFKPIKPRMRKNGFKGISVLNYDKARQNIRLGTSSAS